MTDRARFDTMMDPPIEGLLERAGSKFHLVTLSAGRARQINNYYGQLGDSSGTIVPPQVASNAAKSLTIAFDEIAADKIAPAPMPDPTAEAAEAESTVEPAKPKSASAKTAKAATDKSA